MTTFADIDGVVAGFDTRRRTSAPNALLSTPRKYPVAAAASSLLTPCGANGPWPVADPVRSWNAVTIAAAPSRTDVLRTTHADVPRYVVPVVQNWLAPM